jgi:ribosomal protein S18 acetylase RimI-like enzyme
MSMEEKIIIRKAEISDFQGVHKLIMQVHKLHVNERNDIYKDVEPMNFDEFKTELSNSNNIYLIAEFKNEIVGICFSQIKEISNNKIMKDRKILHIENICVDENHQKKGIGKKLYEQIVQLAKEKNIDNIELMVWGFNENAINFYKNLGMKIKNLKFEQKVK